MPWETEIEEHIVINQSKITILCTKKGMCVQKKECLVLPARSVRTLVCLKIEIAIDDSRLVSVNSISMHSSYPL